MGARVRRMLLVAVVGLGLLGWAGVARADALSIVYTSPQMQTATVGAGFTAVVFEGFVLNNTGAPITFQLTGGPEPFEPYVASFIDWIGFPGITLGAGQSTGLIDLATINLNPFDPSLPYPGTVNVVLDAIFVDPATGHTGDVITENNASIEVRTVAEPGTLLLVSCGFVFGVFIAVKFPGNR